MKVVLIFGTSALALAMWACGNNSDSDQAPDTDGGSSGTSDAGTQSDSSSPSPEADGGTDAEVDGPRLLVNVRAKGDAVAHPEGTSGQTPEAQVLAIRSLTLLSGADDPAPYVVFDYGANSHEASLVPGADTEVASVAASSLRPGSYTVARCGVAYVSYRVAAVMHTAGQRIPGFFDNLHVLSDAVDVAGSVHDRGHYSFSFAASVAGPVTLEGEDAAIPQVQNGGGFSLDLSTPDAAYVFPVALTIPEGVDSSYRILFDLNTHENFRWADQSASGYVEGVFDATPTSYEPVMSFGANSFALSIEALP